MRSPDDPESWLENWLHVPIHDALFLVITGRAGGTVFRARSLPDRNGHTLRFWVLAGILLFALPRHPVSRVREIRLTNSTSGRSGNRGIVMVTGLVFLLAVIGLVMPVPFQGRVAVATGDLAHAPLFGGIALILLWLLERFRPVAALPFREWVGRSVLVFLILFAFGAGMELVQNVMGRHAAFHDAVANGLGILAAILCFWAWQLSRRKTKSRWIPRSMFLAAGFLLAIAWWTPAAILWDVAKVRRDFPMLASFESEIELQRFFFRDCRPRLTRRDATDQRYAMEITFAPTSYPAATLFEMQPDWSGAEKLELDVVLDESYSGESVEFMVKVVDSHHSDDHADTFRQSFRLKRGIPTHIEIDREDLVSGPDTRPLDLSSIRYVDLLVLMPGENTKIRVDSLRLTLQKPIRG